MTRKSDVFMGRHNPHTVQFTPNGSMADTLRPDSLVFPEQESVIIVWTDMHAFSTETIIRHEGELHLEHLPLHVGEKVKVLICPPEETDKASERQAEYEAFMKGYADEDSIYDLP
jgi:hypothetical protein